MTDDDVYVSTRKHTRDRVYHTDPECRALQHDPRSIQREALWAEARLCSYCAGTWTPPDAVSRGHYNALLRAAEGEE